MTEAATEVDHLDVLIIGAGISGIAAAHYVQAESPWASFAIFESRDAIGGTWDLFRYPGIRSDSDMYTLGYSFRPWMGEKAITDGPSILQYLHDTVDEEGLGPKIRFGHRITGLDWSTPEARWHVTAERTDTGETVHLTAGFVMSCTGYYRYDQGYQPEFAGLDRYQGTFVHPQHWPEDLDHAGKRIVVIGSGATAVTLLPSLAETAEHVTMLQRSPGYIANVPAKSPIAKLLRRVLPPRWSAPAIRWAMALGTQGSYHLSKRRPELVKKVLRRGVERQLPAGYDIDTHFTPSYNPWDQRVCADPDGSLFAAIRHGKASVVTDHIDSFTETGIRLASGQELPADIVVSATGLDMLFMGGIHPSVDGEVVDIAHRLIYKGSMLEGVPNLVVAIGYTNASWTLKAELTCEYATRLMNRMRATGLRQCVAVNHDADLTTAPALDLNAGYINRAADRFPKQGSAEPWKVHHNYWRDYRTIKRGRMDDSMVFSNPAPRRWPGSASPVVADAAAAPPTPPAASTASTGAADRAPVDAPPTDPDLVGSPS